MGDRLVVDVRARILWSGSLWAEGWHSAVLLEPGRRARVRLQRSQGPFTSAELLELELDLQPDPEEVQRLRARIRELEDG
jgi:hypothetical protein